MRPWGRPHPARAALLDTSPAGSKFSGERATPRVSASTVRVSKKYTWSGELKPRHTAGVETVTLNFYRKQGGSWVLRRQVDAVNYNYSSYSRFKASTTLPAKGSWRVQAYAPADAGHAATAGSWKYFTVK